MLLVPTAREGKMERFFLQKTQQINIRNTNQLSWAINYLNDGMIEYLECKVECKLFHSH